MSVDPSDVRAIAEFEMLDDSTLNTFIQDSEGVVTDFVRGVSDNTHNRIVKWVAAHLASMKQQRLKSEEFSDASLDYEGKQGMNLNYTRYGQQAIMMDPTDSLGRTGHYTTAVRSESEYEKIDSPQTFYTY